MPENQGPLSWTMINVGSYMSLVLPVPSLPSTFTATTLAPFATPLDIDDTRGAHKGDITRTIRQRRHTIGWKLQFRHSEFRVRSRLLLINPQHCWRKFYTFFFPVGLRFRDLQAFSEFGTTFELRMCGEDAGICKVSMRISVLGSKRVQTHQ